MSQGILGMSKGDMVTWDGGFSDQFVTASQDFPMQVRALEMAS